MLRRCRSTRTKKEDVARDSGNNYETDDRGIILREKDLKCEEGEPK